MAKKQKRGGDNLKFCPETSQFYKQSRSLQHWWGWAIVLQKQCLSWTWLTRTQLSAPQALPGVIPEESHSDPKHGRVSSHPKRKLETLKTARHYSISISREQKGEWGGQGETIAGLWIGKIGKLPHCSQHHTVSTESFQNSNNSFQRHEYTAKICMEP